MAAAIPRPEPLEPLESVDSQQAEVDQEGSDEHAGLEKYDAAGSDAGGETWTANSPEYEDSLYWDQVNMTAVQEGRELGRSEPLNLLNVTLSVFTKTSARILVMGCGTSVYPTAMYDDYGYHNIVAMDFAPETIKYMRKNHGSTRPGLEFVEQDVRAMEDFDDESFDVAIDLGLTDCIGCYQDGYSAATMMMKEVMRVLKTYGQYYFLSGIDTGVCWSFHRKVMELIDTRIYDELVMLPLKIHELLDEGQEEGFWRDMQLCEKQQYTHPTKKILRKLADGSMKAGLQKPEFWRSLVRLEEDDLPLMACNKKMGHLESSAPCVEFTSASIIAADSFLRHGGYAVVDVDWETTEVPLAKMSAAMDMLKRSGWPPAFIFMYDATWRFIDGLFDVIKPLLRTNECVVEASVYAWALDACNPGEHDREAAHQNFGLPHRDNKFSDSCYPDGRVRCDIESPNTAFAPAIRYRNQIQQQQAPCLTGLSLLPPSRTAGSQPKVLTVWCPVNDATLDNGCIYVVPKQHDPLWGDDQHPKHLIAASRMADDNDDGGLVKPLRVNFPLQHVRPLPARAGNVVIWNANTIHWGSSCSAGAEPRKSIALSFMPRECITPEFVEECKQLTDRPPLTRQQCRSLTVEERLQIVAKGLIIYRHWFPNYEGMEVIRKAHEFSSQEPEPGADPSEQFKWLLLVLLFLTRRGISTNSQLRIMVALGADEYGS